MKKILSAFTAATLAFPLSALACDGSITCAMRAAPRQMLHLLPGFFSTHAGLLIGIALGAAVIATVSRREAGAKIVRKE
jgi:hypothetical protein